MCGLSALPSAVKDSLHPFSVASAEPTDFEIYRFNFQIQMMPSRRGNL